LNFVDLDADDPRLAAFHAGVYLDAFAAQHEPLEVWRSALRGERPYELTVRVAMVAERIVGGITFERYPRSGCGLLTYLVVAPEERGFGVGDQLTRHALGHLSAPVVLGEVNDPRLHGHYAWQRLERFQQHGARTLDARYIQPALAPGLVRDRQLVLIAFAGEEPLPDEIDGGPVTTFIDELYAVTEGGPPDPEVSIPPRIRLYQLTDGTR
jgi:GNAT superfamily N-acetyltransferase